MVTIFVWIKRGLKNGYCVSILLAYSCMLSLIYYSLVPGVTNENLLRCFLHVGIFYRLYDTIFRKIVSAAMFFLKIFHAFYCGLWDSYHHLFRK